MKRCKNCYMPDTRPGSVFNSDGVCQACLNYESRKNVDWEKREEKLSDICGKCYYLTKNSVYDCVIAVSGGKDSYFIVSKMVDEMAMNPLLVTVTDSFTHTQAGIDNLRNLIEVFGVNHIQYTINHDLFKRATRAAFEETGEALQFVEYAIYTIPVLIAQQFGIPLVVFGENSAFEYGTTTDDTYNATEKVQAIDLEIEKFGDRYADILLEDDAASIRLDPTKKVPQVIYMSYFYPWSSTGHLKVAKKYGFHGLRDEWVRDGYISGLAPPLIEDFEQIDSVAYLVHLWMKYPKYGFQRVSDIASRRVRECSLTREEAAEIVDGNDYKLDRRAMQDFINTLEYTEEQFWTIVKKHWNEKLLSEEEFRW